jgi:hypothetical protein
MIKRNIKLARLQVSRVCRRSSRVYLEIIRFILCDEIEKGASEVREETVVLFLNCVSEHIVFLEEVAVVDVESCELVFAHCVDLLDVDEFTICDLWEIAIRSRGRRQSHLFSKTKRNVR